MRINKTAGHLQDWITQQWVKITGRRFDPNKDAWLIGPIGDTDIIKDKFFRELAEKQNLEITENSKDSGLLDSFDALELTPEETTTPSICK